MSRILHISDKQLDQAIGIILRGGVIISALAVFAGGIMYLIKHGFDYPNYRIFHGEPADLRSLTGIFKGAAAWQSVGIIQFGLLLLIATPVVRVAFSIFGFALQRDWVYVMVTMIVLALLLFSLISGGVHAWHLAPRI